MKFHIFNGGTCTRLKLFGEDIRKLLINNNWIESNFNESDCILINSCSFLKTREDYFINFIGNKNALRKKNQKIIVFGCLPKTNPSRINKIDSSILLFSRDIKQISDYFGFVNKKITTSNIVDSELNFTKSMVAFLNKHFIHDSNIDFRLLKKNVFHISISQGCLGNCSYCSEKFTTKFKSKKINEIVKCFNSGLSSGFKLFSLNSDDSSCFGLDNGENIFDLLRKLIFIDKEFKILISEFNPQGLQNKEMEIFKSGKISYITIPVQSGSQNILNKMKRPYRITEIIRKIREIRKINPNLKINTHLIVGFPGESRKDFIKTLNLVKSGIFDRIKIFRYSDRPGTEASSMPNKIDESIKNKRANILQRNILLDSIKKIDISNFLLNLSRI